MKTANYFVNPPPINAVHFEEIIRFAAEAMRVADRKTLLVIGQVDNVALIQARTGFNLAGYTRALDNYGVCHTMKQHGDPARELKRGQLAVTLEDFGLIPLITGEPVNVYKDGKKRIGRDVIVFVKLICGIGYRHVEEMRGKHKLVATDSMPKKKGAWGAL